MSNKCNKCGKTISDNKKECSSCNRTLWNSVKRNSKIAGGVGVAVVSFVISGLKLLEVFNKGKK